MSKIESIKQYEGQVLDNIFFRPMLTGENAEQLGIKCTELSHIHELSRAGR